jgi:hypothetical protein
MERGPALLPSAVAEVFELTELERDSSSVVIIDPGGTILWTNEAWTRFARDNGGESVPERFGPGRSYFAGISGPIREFFESAFKSALLTKTVFEHEYECSSADEYRLMHLRVLPVSAGALLLQHSIVAEHPQDRATFAEQEARYRRQDGMVVQCSNCRRFRRADSTAWDWVRPWVAAVPPNTSHGICTTCADYYYGQHLREPASP